MNGLEELITRAMDLINVDDDYLACCNKSYHRAPALIRAMAKVARDFHVENKHEQMLATVTSFEACDAFPCRVVNRG